MLGQAINVPNYSIGPNLWPQSAQNPFYNINAFAYPAAFTEGNAGNGIARTGWVWWPQYSITKTWSIQEKYKLTVRMDANNLFPETTLVEYRQHRGELHQPAEFREVPGDYRLLFQQLVRAERDLAGRAQNLVLNAGGGGF